MYSQTLDPSVLALTKAIGQTESGGNYNAVGDNGNSHGAYQFQSGTWKEYANDILGDSNAPMTTENQNKVAYGKVKSWKDQGYTPAQIASKWNSGGFDTYKDDSNATGYNASQGVNFNVPAYVTKVSQAFRQNLGTQTANASSGQTEGYNPKPFSNPNPGQFDFSGDSTQVNTPIAQNSDSLGSEVNSRVKDFTGALTNVVGGEKTGQSRVSGLLQATGAVGGLIGDVTNKALELVPGVKALEGWIGKGAAKLAQTPVGHSVVNSIQSFSQAHPELSKDIGAGINIVTALPILDGIGAVKDVALDGISQALKSTAEKVVTKDLTAAAGKDVSSATIKTLVDNRTIPTITNGVYDTSEAGIKLNTLINTESDPANKLRLIHAQNALSSIEGKPVQLSTLGKITKYAAAGAGELAGEHLGVPLVGGFLGGKLADVAEKSTGNISKGILERSENSLATSAKTALKKTAKGATAGLLQKSLKGK